MNRPSSAERDDRWLLRARALLQAEAGRADPALQRRLQQVRRAALAPRRQRLAGWAIGTALAAAAASLLLVVGPWQLPGESGLAPEWSAQRSTGAAQRADTPIEQVLTLPEEDLALLVGESDYALLEELEFYAWLEQQDHGS